MEKQLSVGPKRSGADLRPSHISLRRRLKGRTALCLFLKRGEATGGQVAAGVSRERARRPPEKTTKKGGDPFPEIVEGGRRREEHTDCSEDDSDAGGGGWDFFSSDSLGFLILARFFEDRDE